MATSDNIKFLRSYSRLSQADFGALFGVSDKAVSTWEKGTREPRMGVIQKMADKFGLLKSDIIDGDVGLLLSHAENSSASKALDLPSNMYPLPEMEKIPLVGSIACGTPILAEENIEAYIDLPRHIRADYALECKGDSMIGVDINDGDIVYIRKQPTVENGQIAAVRIGDEATLKRVYYDGECLQLVAENPKIRPMVFFGEEINDICIEGLAVAHCRSLRGI